MRQHVCRLSTLSLLLFLLVGCAMSVQPRMGASGSGLLSGLPPEDNVRPHPFPGLGDTPDNRPLTDQICRTRPTPSGWFAINYLAGGDRCPQPTDANNPYTVAVIEQHSQKPVGTIMIVCADQPIPSNWIRERNTTQGDECPGARVPTDAPTAVVIQRIR